MCLLLVPLPAAAQQLNCAAPVTQADMTSCAAQDADRADAALNAAYRVAIAQARRMDAGQPGLSPSFEEILRDAQRAWIPFRDAACSAEASLARGGSMSSMLFYLCVEKLTQRRTDDLTYYGQIN